MQACRMCLKNVIDSTIILPIGNGFYHTCTTRKSFAKNMVFHTVLETVIEHAGQIGSSRFKDFQNVLAVRLNRCGISALVSKSIRLQVSFKHCKRC